MGLLTITGNYTDPSGSIGTVTIEPATAGTLNSVTGYSAAPPATSVLIDDGASYVEITNAGMTSSGGAPAIVDLVINGDIAYLEVGQTLKMEAFLDPVTNTFCYCPEIQIDPNGSMVFYTANYPA